MNSPDQAVAHVLDLARQVLRIEAKAVEHLVDMLDESFFAAVQHILQCSGRVIVSGIGKSGHIARKIAATLASTGTPAFFVHPAEASHGDLGMVTKDDVVIALSYSGESAELLTIVPLIKRRGAKLISMTGNPGSTLAAQSDIHLDAGIEQEACPLGLAPTASTTAALALGDALAIALLDARGFGKEDFAFSHPGGTLGRRLLIHVRDVMRTGERLPKISQEAKLADALYEMTRKVMGMVAVVGRDDLVVGIFTDGDLRRALNKPIDLHGTSIDAVMTRAPRCIGPDKLAAEAARHMQQYKINDMVVVDEAGRLLGALNMMDLLRAGVV